MPTIEFSLLHSVMISDGFSNVKKSMNDLKTSGDAIDSQLYFFDSNICDTDTLKTQLQIISDRQVLEVDSVDSLISETDEFFDLVVEKDNIAANEISNRKDDFYENYSYLKPDCEKNGWEKFCDWCSDAAEWCAKHWDIITAVLVVIAVVVIAVASVLTFGAAAVLAVAAVGALVGVVSQFVSDVINFAVTGDWDSNIITYIGAALGGACGGMVTLLTGGNAYIAGMVDSAISTLFTNSVENLTGVAEHSFGETMFQTVLGAGLSAGFTFCFDKLAGKLSKKLSNISFFRRLAGRGSYEASYKGVITRLSNGTAKHFTMKTIRNGVISELAGGSLSTIAGGVFDGIKERVEESRDTPFVPDINLSPIVIPDVPVFEIPEFSF